MGFIRGGLLVIASVLIFLLFIISAIFLTMSLSLQYKNVQSGLSNAVQQIASSEINLTQVINENLYLMNLYCENNSQYNFSQEGYDFVISCDAVHNGTQAIINQTISNFVHDLYYKQYNCSSLDCFEKYQIPTFLVSQKAMNYWKQKFLFIFSIILILLGAMFFLVKKKYNFFFLSGILLIIASLIFSKLNILFSLFSNKIALSIISIFFVELKKVFLIFLISGIVLLVLGIFFRLLSIGFKISDFFNKDKSKENNQNSNVSKEEVKKQVKEEVKKQVKKAKQAKESKKK